MMSRIPAIEKESPEVISRFQLKKLKELLLYLTEYSPFYRQLFLQHSISADQIHSLKDLEKLPVTTKDDLNKFNNDFICVEKNKIIDYVTTSGTLGDPLTFALTEKDLERLAYNEKISLECCDVNEKDIFQLMTTMDRRFMAGLAYFLGIRKLGAGVIRVGNGIPALQWDTIFRIHPTIAIAVPSFIIKLIEYAEQNHIDYTNCSIKKIICIGEPLRNTDFTLNTLGKRIKEKWNVELFSTYASTEMGSAFTECKAGKGGHHHPELIIIELLDENNQQVMNGQPGELTVTTLGVEGMPLLRFKTGDICTVHSESCQCGRTSSRIGPIIGRKQQMLKFKGTTLYPPAINDVLNSIPYIKNYVTEVFTNAIGTDEIIIRIGIINAPSNYEKELKDLMRAKLRVVPAIITDTPENITRIQFPEMSRKPVTFIDRRKI